ncbi:ATP-dependent nuclease [Methylobacterium sp. E-066]|uniref:ATP-dependent nuclease n=1 Tax=Methylobacterium sp. E-066 TaxID=2836584 RepID=UPI001FB95D99|nr:AAA family ATPase [Methylobacterium sp. E-066]MCJ2141503.1 AAA family ATPase [Methylobacterium sp. E-066]
MRLTKLEVINFRGIEHVEVSLDRKISVIVGQNAIGKTTILEAIRLAKSVLSPRFSGEATNVLQQLGVMSPHHQFFGIRGVDARALTANPNTPTTIRLDIRLSDAEREILKEQRQQFARLELQSRLGSDFEANQDRFTQFLSNIAGKEQLNNSLKNVDEYISRLETSLDISLKLTIDHSSGNFIGADNFAQQAVSVIERTLPPNLAKFSYYQADRSFPQGEVQIQLGSQDAQQLVQSHFSTPSVKYHRLKISIAAGVIAGRLSQNDLEKNFSAVFDALLPGKSFSKVEISQIGVVRVVVRDKISGKEFDIDGLSSGEKGLVLTFLSLFESLADGAIVLLDEPELHLNPGVTRNIIKTLLERVCATANAQLIVTTHSAEILSDAYESEDCRLYTLRGPKDLSPVYPEDSSKVIEILNDLGVTTADVLFNKGAIFVEGPHDSELLSDGFGDVISSYKITKMGGRFEVEKAVKSLEKNTDPTIRGKRQLFIIDGDRKKTDLKTVGDLHVLQWSKYCFENYLIDDRVLYNVINENTKSTVGSRAEFASSIRELAFGQISNIAIKQAYAEFEPENSGLRPSEMKDKSITEFAEVLWNRIARIVLQTSNLNKSTWIATLTTRASEIEANLQSDWIESWRSDADGKILLEDIFQKYTVNVDRLTMKRKIIKAMKNEGTENWHTIKALISAELA